MTKSEETARIDVRVLAAISLFVSKEETRYYLNGVCLEIEPSSVTYVATDGHRLVAYHDSLFDADNANTCVGTFIIPTAQCRVFKCKKDGIPAASLSQDASTLTLEYEGLGLTFPPIDGAFPDWRRTVPAGDFHDEPAQFNLSYLNDFARFAKLLSLPAPFVRHNDMHSPASIEFGGYPHIVAVQMPMCVEGHASRAVLLGRKLPPKLRPPNPDAHGRRTHARQALALSLSLAAQAPFREAVERVEIRLPMPPSVNRLWRPIAKGKQIRSAEYEAWRTHAGLKLVKQRPGRIVGRYRLTIALGCLSLRADPDNFLKATSDLLVTHGIVADDRLAVEARAIRDDKASERGVVVTVTTVEAQP